MTSQIRSTDQEQVITDQRKIRWRRLRGDGVKLVPLLFAPLGEGVLLALVVQLVRVRVRVRVRLGLGSYPYAALTPTPN